MDIPDWPGDGVRLEGKYIRSIFESFIKILHQKPCQVSTHPPKFLPGVLEDIPDWPGDGVRWEVTSIRSICERFIKIWQQELCHITNVLLKIFISKICIFEHFHRGWMPPKSTFLGSKSTRFSVPIHQKNNGGVKKLPRLPSSLRGVFFETPCT